MDEMNIPMNPTERGSQWEDADNRTFTETIFFNRDDDHVPDADVEIRVQGKEPAPEAFKTPIGEMSLVRWEGIGRFEGGLYELGVMSWNSGGFKLVRKITPEEARKVISEKSPILSALFV